MALYLGSKKVAGNTTSESLDDDVKDYKVTFDDSGEVEGITNIDAFMNNFKSKLILANLFSIIKAGFKIIKDNIANLTTSNIKSTDTEGLLGSKNAQVVSQELIDEIANKVVNELVTNQNLTNTLADYVSKSMISTSIENNSNKVAATSLVSQLNNDLSDLNGINRADDCNNIGTNGKFTVHRYDVNTLNSPYKAGLSGAATAGFVFTMKNSSQYGIQVAYIAGAYNNIGLILSRGLNSGNWLDWHPIVQTTTRQTGITTNFGLTLDVMKSGGVVNLRIYGRVTSGTMTEGSESLLTTLSKQFQPAYSMGWNCYTSQGGGYCPFLIRVDYNRNVYMNIAANIENIGYINVTYVYGCES